MGYIRKANAIEAYRQIRKEAVGRVCSILILAAPTVDAICALKILTVIHFISSIGIYNAVVSVDERFFAV